MPVEWWCPFLMPAAASWHDFWQDFLRAGDPVLTAPSYQAGYPARLADGRRILLVGDVLSTGTSLSAVLRLLVKAGRPPAAIGVAMTQTQAWRAVLGRIDSRWPTVVRSAMSTPLLVPHQDGGWRPEAEHDHHADRPRDTTTMIRGNRGRSS